MKRLFPAISLCLLVAASTADATIGGGNSGGGSSTPGGSNGQYQYNNNGAFAGVTSIPSTSVSGLGTAATKNTTGSGAAIPTGPTSPTSGDLVTFGTAGMILDSNTAPSQLAPLASPAFTGTPTLNGTAFGTFATQNYATPPAIGGTTPNAISATTLNTAGATTVQATGTATSGNPIVSPNLNINGVGYYGTSQSEGVTVTYTPVSNPASGTTSQLTAYLNFAENADKASGTFHVTRFNSSNSALSAVNSNDYLGGAFFETYNTALYGFDNLSSSANGVVPANAVEAFLGISNNGKVGTLVPYLFQLSGGSPTWRNIIDDGNGNSSVSKTETALSFATSVTTVAASATPALVSTNGLQAYTLAQNTVPSISGIAVGQRVTFEICQPASGGPYTWTWPAAIHGGMTVGTTANTCSIQSFDSFSGTTLVAESGGIAGVSP